MPSLFSSSDASFFGVPDELVALIASHPRIGSRFGPLYAQVMMAPGKFSRRERGIIAAVSAMAQDCTYLAQTQLEWLRVEGEDSDLIAAIRDRRSSEVTGNSGRRPAFCRLADKLSATPTRMTPDDWHPLISSVVDQLGLIEFAYVVGLTNYLTRLAEGFGAHSHEPVIAVAAEHIRGNPTETGTSNGATGTRADEKPVGEVCALGWFLNVHSRGSPADSPYNFGYRSEMGILLSAHPQIGPAFWGLFSEIMFAPGTLTRAEREMVAAVAAAAQDCHY
jgi:alkylhydroperoxidase family enzyme